jgi:hypothetical protein
MCNPFSKKDVRKSQALTLFNLRRGKTSACAASRYDDTEAETVDCCSCSISEVMDES